MVALRNSSKAFWTDADCSWVVLSSHSLAAARRDHPASVAARFTSPHFGCHCGPASSDSAVKNAGTKRATLRLDSSDLAVLLATTTTLTETVSTVCPGGIKAG